MKHQDNVDYLHKGENCHSKNNTEEKDEELTNDYLKPELKLRIKDELEKQEKEQQILLKDHKENIIDFIIDNKESIRIEDLKIYERVYKCYRQKGNCNICNVLTNIICKNWNNDNSPNDNREVWLCTDHWKKHTI